MLKRPPLDRRRAWAGLVTVCVLIVGLRLLAGAHPDIVEYAYARSIYPRIATILSTATAWFPFSIAEVVTVLLVVVGLINAARVTKSILRSAERLRALGDAVLRIAIGVGAAYLVFLLIWGLNYQRRPLADNIGLAIAAPQPGELAAACAELIKRSEELRASVVEDGAGVAVVRGGIASALASASLGYEVLDDQWPLVAGEPVPAKRVLLSPGLALLGMSGIFVPFTGEANINTTLPEWTLPFVAAHELAHQRGFAREDEANYLAYASCARHPDPAARYSAALEGSLFTLAALRVADPEAHRALQELRSPAVRRDIEALESWRRKYGGRAAAIHEKVNDAYLRAQGQDGVTTYGRMVDLLLAERRAR